VPVREVKIVNPQGLHMRPAAKFVETVNRFNCNVAVRKGDQKVDGRSIMELIQLEALAGTTLCIEGEGDDAEACLEALAQVVANFDKD
jgi:phosphocarrier protein HPr